MGYDQHNAMLNRFLPSIQWNSRISQKAMVGYLNNAPSNREKYKIKFPDIYRQEEGDVICQPVQCILPPYCHLYISEIK